MKLFKTNNINIVSACYDHFSFHSPSAWSAMRVAEFEFQFNFNFTFLFVDFLQFTLLCLCSFYRISANIRFLIATVLIIKSRV